MLFWFFTLWGFNYARPLFSTQIGLKIEKPDSLGLENELKIAAFEGARVGMITGSIALNVEAQSQLVLTDHGVINTSISMTPNDPATLTDGDFFRVTVAAQCAPNSLIGGWFYSGKTFSESVELAFH